MTLRGCHRGVKYTLFIFNLFFWLTGAVTFSLGVWMRCDDQFGHLIFGPNDLLPHHAEAYTLITVGSVVMLISFFACIGALLENQCMLAVFFAFMFVIFSVLLTGGILTFVTSRSVPDTVDRVLRQAARDYGNSSTSKLMLDFIQLNFNCCRLASDEITPSPDQRASVCSQKCFKSCIRNVVDYYTDVQRIIATIAVSVACTSLMGIMLSIVLCLAVREQRQLLQQEEDADSNLVGKNDHKRLDEEARRV